MSHSTRTKSIKKDAITQTSDTDTMSEIVRLQELVKHLTIENERLKKYAFNTMLLTENQTNIHNPSTSAQNVQRKSNKLAICGCKCKKNCSTKLCGCIKKGISCGELCKCVSCKNLENADQNKENVEHSDTTTFHENISGSNNIFHNSTSTEYLTVPSYFNSSEQITSVSNDEEKEKEDKDRKDIQINDKISQSSVTQRKNRSKRNNPKRGKQKQSDVDIKEETLRMCSSNEIPVYMNEKLKQIELKIEERTSENFQNIGQGMTTLKCNRSKAVVSSINEMKRKDNTNFNLKEENNFNPMKPTYELPRTPPNSNSDVSSRNISEVSLPTSFIITEIEEALPLPKEFNLPHVNWEEYHSQLVECNKCRRKFHPYRIKKHQACCKKV